ncbi:MAG: hypothetical protein FD161_54 [Limisphaerales bacterium]|nr:MAG: hypothetical protein FD161_54 [Limisphaerales bacterium]KAG0510500.1 MAG: hypothetical protein E1N63_54 [Limisphaerales bacterium]TXT52773.1 MAG: hypothetical protein FD140_316 [Limisphaerales bacterium]
MLYTPSAECFIIRVKTTTGVISTQGQFTLPKAWRDAWGITQGTSVAVFDLEDGEGTLLVKPISKPKRGLKGLAKMMERCPGELPVPERHVLPFRDPLKLG